MVQRYDLLIDTTIHEGKKRGNNKESGRNDRAVVILAISTSR